MPMYSMLIFAQIKALTSGYVLNMGCAWRVLLQSISLVLADTFDLTADEVMCTICYLVSPLNMHQRFLGLVYSDIKWLEHGFTLLSYNRHQLCLKFSSRAERPSFVGICFFFHMLPTSHVAFIYIKMLTSSPISVYLCTLNSSALCECHLMFSRVRILYCLTVSVLVIISEAEANISVHLAFINLFTY